jgi:hypothetical protein
MDLRQQVPFNANDGQPIISPRSFSTPSPKGYMYVT